MMMASLYLNRTRQLPHYRKGMMLKILCPKKARNAGAPRGWGCAELDQDSARKRV